MRKLDQRILELQAVIGNPDFDEIIREKLIDVWRDTRNDYDHEHTVWQNEYLKRLNAGLTKAEKTRMEESHRWIMTNDVDEECGKCKLDMNWFYNWPQYCEPEPKTK